MIDFTKIQTVPVPPSITDLQATNGKLSKENKNMRIVIYVAAAVTIGCIAYFIYKKHKEDEASKQNQSKRD